MSSGAEGHEYLGEVLVRRGVVPAERLVPLFDTARERGQALTDLLVAANVTDEARIAQALADECGVSFMPKVDADALPLSLVTRLPITYDKAHKIVMDEGGKDCAWVHAYLHRVEGDLGNARYWYGQAQRAVSSKSLDAEWDAMARELLDPQ